MFLTVKQANKIDKAKMRQSIDNIEKIAARIESNTAAACLSLFIIAVLVFGIAVKVLFL